MPPFTREGDPRRRRKRLLILLAALLLLFAIVGGILLDISIKANTGQRAVATRAPEETETKWSGTTTTGHKLTPGATVTVPALAPATSTPGVTPTPTKSEEPVPFQVQSVEITFDPPEATGSCLSIVTVTYIATIMVAPNGPGGIVDFDYSSNNGQSYEHAELTFAPGETSQTFTFSRQLTLSIQLGSLALDVKHTGIVTTTSPNTITQQATPKVGCS
ncbi:hypothetical protein [Ktedonospora formicarum]|uniref:Uncharacterized protein n=1 Tax=Ktedonospora formicarum TaxID=2778364 RepID=A0A8J3MVP4_9CHLR|nr:hypothetical protein [Ktedonospora formicarum]GHO48146.1 hypothetical protein KSX_63090 [Ktedonospora formicarum]